MNIKSASSCDISALQAETVLGIIQEHLIDSHAPERGYYDLPVKRIKEGAGLSGAAVYGHVRNAGGTGRFGSPTEPHDAPPFIDLIGVGLAGERRRVPWLAIRSNRPEQLAQYVHKAANAPRPPQGDSERCRVFNTLARRVLECESMWQERSIPGADVSHVAADARKDSFVVVLCPKGSQGFMARKIPSGTTVVEVDATPFLERALDVAACLRPFFGEGWLPGLAGMADAVESASRGSRSSIILARSKVGDLGSGEKARIAAREFMHFGWLSFGTVAPTENVKGSGIHLCSPGGFSTWNDGLPVGNPREMRFKRAETYESGFDHDFALIAFKFHGVRNDTSAESPLSSRWFGLPLIRWGGVTAVLRLLGKVPIDVILFEGGSSRTSDAGVLERILALAKPERGVRGMKLLNAVLPAIMPSLLAHGWLGRKKCRSPLQLSLALELGDPEAVKRHVSIDTGHDFKGMKATIAAFGLFLRIFRRAIGKGRPQAGGMSFVFSGVLRNLFGLTPEQAAYVADVGSLPAGELYREMKERTEAIEHSVNEELDQGTRCRTPIGKLAGGVDFILGMAARGRLMVPDFIQEWLQKRTRIVVIAPADRPWPGTVAPRRRRRSTVGGWMSFYSYERLFSTTEDAGSIRMDLSPLLRAVRSSFVCGSQSKNPGWLANKASETNELITFLMIEADHMSSFDIGRLPPKIQDINDSDLLDLLDSKLMVRCITSSEEGTRAADCWMKSLAALAQAELMKKATLERVTHLKSSMVDIPEAKLTQMFSDREGIISAALTVARGLRGDECAAPTAVFFSVGKMGDFFSPPESEKTFKPDDNVCLEKFFGDPFALQAGKNIVASKKNPRVQEGGVLHPESDPIDHMMERLGNTAISARLLADLLIYDRDEGKIPPGDNLEDWLAEMEARILHQTHMGRLMAAKLDDVEEILRSRGALG